MYTIEIFYNGEWHIHDTVEHYYQAAPIAKALQEAIGDDPAILITIEPHEIPSRPCRVMQGESEKI